MCFLSEIQGQYILDRQVLSNAGGNIINAGVLLEYTVGETISTDISDGNYAINQGFHQYFTSTVSTDKIENNLFKFYPNPVSGICYLQFDKVIKERSTLVIYNVAGGMIYSKSIQIYSKLIPLDLSEMLPGTYFAILKDNKNLNTSSFKLIKI